MIEHKNHMAVDEYIDSHSKDIKELLNNVRATIKSVAFNVIECMSYGMPCYKYNGKALVYFAAMKHHLGFYPTAQPMTVFKDKLTPYSVGKGCIRFDYKKPIPYELIAEITSFQVANSESI